MGYIKTEWTNYDKNLSLEENIVRNAILTAQLMNHLEDGVATANKPLAIGSISTSKTDFSVSIEETEDKILLHFVLQQGDQGVPGVPGKSVYQIALDNGFEGDEKEWLESLKGKDGKSAYQVALDNGFDGDEKEWLESLKGKDGIALWGQIKDTQQS